MKKTLFSLIALLLLGSTVKAQVGINTLSPDTTAILHVYSDNKGVLFPTLNRDNRNSLGSAPAAEGLLVYDSIDKTYYFFNRAQKKWLAMNPFQTTDENNLGSNDVRLGKDFENRNVVIGEGIADANAKLHVKGNIKSSQTVYAPNADISDSIWSSEIGSNSLKTATANITTANVNTAQITTADIGTITGTVEADTILADSIQAKIVRSNFVYGAVPIGAIVMWDGATIPPCWTRVTAMDGRFPVGVQSGVYRVATVVDDVGKQGMNEVVLAGGHIPQHTHSLYNTNRNEGGMSLLNYTNGSETGNVLSWTGTASAHENRPPFYGVYFIKKTSNNCPN